jgi:hypothetical protein
MPDPDSLDLRKFLDKSTSKTSLSDLQKKGVSSVKVLDERTLHKLIQEAVSRIISGRPELLTEGERQKIYDDSRKELDRLIREYTTTKKQNEAVSQDRNTLVAELENLQKQLEITRRMYEEKLRQKESEAGNSGRAKELEAQLRMVQEQSERRFQEGVKSQEPYIGELKARIQMLESELAAAKETAATGAISANLEALAKKNDAVAERLTKLFNKTIDGLSRKISSLKPGGLDEEIEYKPNEMVLENLLKQELESNLGTVTSKEVASKEAPQSGSVDERLAKLRNVQKGFGKPKEEEKKDQ